MIGGIKSFGMSSCGMLLTGALLLPGPAIAQPGLGGDLLAQADQAADKEQRKKDRKARKRDRKNKKWKHKGHRGGMMGAFKAVWHQLDLNQEQRDKLFALQQEFKRTTFEGQMAKDEGQHELHKLMTAEKLDEGEVGAQIEKLTKSFRGRLEAMVDFVKKVRAILTPEQAKKLHEIMKDMPPPGPPGGHGGHGGPPPDDDF